MISRFYLVSKKSELHLTLLLCMNVFFVSVTPSPTTYNTSPTRPSPSPNRNVLSIEYCY